MSQVLFFFREPILGRVKTRLAREIGAKDALRIYTELVERNLLILKNTPAVGYLFPFIDRAPSPSYRRVFGKKWGTVYLQKGMSLGERMEQAIETVYRRHQAPTLVIGSDTARLSPTLLRQAVGALSRFQVVLGPCRDGGYYLIGVQRPCPGLFKAIAWSRPSVLADQLRRIRCLGLSFHLLERGFDVDTKEDHRQYCRLLTRSGPGDSESK